MAAAYTTDGWKQRGFTVLWGADGFTGLCAPDEVFSLRSLFQFKLAWPEELPHCRGRALVVAGLLGTLDALGRSEGRKWLEAALAPMCRSFQSQFGSECALIFWVPGGRQRVKVNLATDEMQWLVHGEDQGNMPLFHLLWGGGAAGIQRLMPGAPPNEDPDSERWAGLHLARIS